MRDKFYDLCGKVNYDTYNQISKKSLYASLATVISSLLGVPTYIAIPIEVSLFMIYFVTSFSDGDKHTKDTSKINELYQEFLDNYIKFQSIFNIENPIELYTIFTFLLDNGYLSKNKEIIYDNMHAYDIKSLFALDVINGVCSCRHRASMLSDILNKSNFDSRVLSVYQRDSVSTIKMIDEGKISWLKFLDWYNKNEEHIDNETLKIIDNLLDNYSNADLLPIDFEYKFIDSKDKTLKATGNHMITCCSDSEYGYFLDPTQKRMYHVIDPKKKIIGDEYDDSILIRPYEHNLFDSKKHHEILNNCLKLPNKSSKEARKLKKQTLLLCRDNIDAFEKFYRDNSSLYYEISNGLTKVRKK